MCVKQFFVIASLLSLASAASPASLSRLLSQTVDSKDRPTTTNDVIQLLYHEVVAAQWQDSKPYEFPSNWGHEQGTFQNNIKINFVGSSLFQSLREAIYFPDNNGFVTTFVLEALGQTSKFTPPSVITPLNDKLWLNAVKALLKTHDHYNPSDVPIFGFWPQKMFNHTNDTAKHKEDWRQYSINLSQLASDENLFREYLTSILQKLGLTVFLPELEGVVHLLCQTVQKLFSIPADTDDSAANYALSRFFVDASVARQLPNTSNAWNQVQFNFSKSVELWMKYAVCPRSDDLSRNLVDVRTFFWARPFLTSKQFLQNSSQCIVSTWLSNYNEIHRIWDNQTVRPKMPFNVNNLDPTVGADAVFAMSTAIVRNESDWLHRIEGASELYLSTATFVAWSLETQRHQSRPDLETLYYPMTINLPMFVGQHVQFLREASALDSSLFRRFPVMEKVFELLSLAVRNGGTDYIVDQSKTTCDVHQTANYTCWDSFLGNNDTDFWGRPTPHYNDRLYTTAAAVYSLVTAWTIPVSKASGETKQLQFIEGTPSHVKKLINSGAIFLHDQVLGLFSGSNVNGSASPLFENAFFSGSVHARNTMPFGFPANVIQNLATGKTYSCSNLTFFDFSIDLLFGFNVNTNITDAEYTKLVAAGCGGVKHDPQFMGFNDPLFPFPYWSAPVVSKAFILRTLSMWNAID